MAQKCPTIPHDAAENRTPRHLDTAPVRGVRLEGLGPKLHGPRPSVGLRWRFVEPEVTVRAEPAELGCDGTAEVVATARTNGAPGVIRYRWLRSDGTVSGELTQSVSARQQEARLVLRWTFNGRGTQRAGAVVDILSPTPHTASAGFTYRCR